ncbi:DUF4143 domain-containing protein [Desulfotignum phosphitoxidans]|nr:DUF4143 domain-containing protein [Desulfotignum phosphitoxidans]
MLKKHTDKIIITTPKDTHKTIIGIARNNKETLLNINLERYPELAPIFSGKDPIEIIQQLEFLPNMGEINKNALLFLDEIQAVPEAIAALRYFYEDKPEIPVICAGSLLEFVLSDHSFIMHYTPDQKIGEIVHNRLSSLLRSYYYIGGMPEAIAVFADSHCSGLPLQADLEEKVYKTLFLDVGLMNAVCGLNWHIVSQMDDIKLINEGAIAEQFIGQHLQHLLADSPNRDLTYWLREGRSSNAELDFVIGIAGSIIPIEVKAGPTGKLKSLHQFMGQKKAPFAIRFDSSLPSVHQIKTVINIGKERKDVNYPLISLPLYLIERLEFIVEDYLEHHPYS